LQTLLQLWQQGILEVGHIALQRLHVGKSLVGAEGVVLHVLHGLLDLTRQLLGTLHGGVLLVTGLL